MPIPVPRLPAAVLALLASLLPGAAAAAPASAGHLACLRMLQAIDAGNRYETVCADVLAHPATPADPLVELALRRLVEDRVHGLPADTPGEVLALPRETVSAHADNPVFLLYAARALQSPHNRGKVTPDMVAFADMLAAAALREPSLRKPELVQHLQGIVTVALRQHLRLNDVEGVAAWLARLEESCIDPANCFAAYSGAIGSADSRNTAATYRALANLLADRHGIGDWRTGVAAMALAAMTPPAPAGASASDGRETIYRPFVAEWIRADVITRQPATVDWFMTIARVRFGRGDYHGSQELTDYLWARAKAGRLYQIDLRGLADLAINTRICQGQYEEAAAFGAGYKRLWDEKYAPRLRPEQ